MAEIRFYKKFYEISVIQTGTTIELQYNNFNPAGITAYTQNSSNNFIETNLTPTYTGNAYQYFTDLDPSFYAGDMTYTISWIINYENNTTKTISESFRINPQNVANSIDIEVSVKY